MADSVNDFTLFLSTPSARRATALAEHDFVAGFISIHALREEGDAHIHAWVLLRYNISIHALREEGDVPFRLLPADLSEFLSTPSARRATVSVDYLLGASSISIHALREEGDFSRPPRPWF